MCSNESIVRKMSSAPMPCGERARGGDQATAVSGKLKSNDRHAKRHGVARTHEHDVHPRDVHRGQLVEVEVALPVQRAREGQDEARHPRQHLERVADLREHHEGDEAQGGQAPPEVVRQGVGGLASRSGEARAGEKYDGVRNRGRNSFGRRGATERPTSIPRM